MEKSNPYGNIFNSGAQTSRNVTIDLAARYYAAFGMSAVRRMIDKAFVQMGDAQNGYFFDYYPEMSSEIEYVKFEIPNFEPLEFSSVMLQSSASFGDRAVFAPPLMMTFSQEKNLIETEVNDADPIIVERWGTKQWKIDIKGILIDLKNGVYPSDEIRRLNQNWQYNGVVKAVGMQFEEKDIDSFYFKSIEFSPTEGFQDTIQFSMEAASIKSVNFTLLKPNEN